MAVPAVAAAAREGDGPQGRSPTPPFTVNVSAARNVSAAPGVGYASGSRAVAFRAAGPPRRNKDRGIAIPPVAPAAREGDGPQGRSPTPRFGANFAAGWNVPPRPAWGMPPACVRSRSARPGRLAATKMVG